MKLPKISKMDLEMMYHWKKHGKFIDGEILARCPICKEDHRVIHFMCKCGDPFFVHLNNQSSNYDLFPTGKIDVTKANWSKMFE